MEGIERDTCTGDTKESKKNKGKSNERNINKKLKLEGKSYKRRKGKEMPAVPPAQFTPSKCKNKCSEKFSMESREKMHAQYWSMQSYDQCRQFIVDTILSLTKKQKRVPGESRKSWTWHCYLTRELEDGIIEHVEVWKNVYYNALQVKEKFAHVAVSSATTGIGKQEQRGKKAPANKTKGGNLQTVYDQPQHVSKSRKSLLKEKQ